MLYRFLTCRIAVILLTLLLICSSKTLAQTEKLIISEIMAINDTIFADEDGDYTDWIELYNPGETTINLNGWYLTDDPLNPTKWEFPNVSLSSNNYIVVFASDKNRTSVSGNLHTNFKLSGSGEYLALIEPDASTISFEFSPSYPSQTANVSYGIYEENYIYMPSPSPGKVNVIGETTPEPIFSKSRGFYNSTISVELSSPISGCDIYYTLDGSIPKVETATKYTSEITVNSTTVISGITVNSSTLVKSKVVSHSFIYPDSVLIQSNTPVGYPDTWGQGYPADYEMDPDVCTEANKTLLIESLKSLPTVSFVTNSNHLFSHEDTDSTGGIYIYSTNHEEAWERPVSMEYFDSANGKTVQLNCGIRIHGGNSRKPSNSPKHGFRVSFRSDYGPSKFKFNFFDEKSATNEFNALVFRAGYNYSWIKNAPVQCEGADYIRDPFTKVTQLDMDRTAAHNKFVHLYINGIYWGVYNVSEKITNDFTEAYLGGEEDDYDVVKDHVGTVDGDRLVWDELLSAVSNGFSSNEDYYKVQGKNTDGTINPAYKNLLDVRNFVDYMLLNFYIGNKDWDKNNWIAARNRVTNDHGFKFFSWDPETSMNDVNENIVNLNNAGNPSGILTKLKENDEFKLYFADRIQKHFFNNGALTPSVSEARYMSIANTIEKSLLAESARWGDYRRDVDPGSNTYELYTPNDHWKPRVEYVQNTYLPQRTEIVFNQLKNAGFYPDIEAPVFSQFGGEFESPIDLEITSNTGTIYYTIDDTDPREIGGTISSSGTAYSTPLNLENEVIVKARTKDGENWSALTRAKFKFNTNIELTPPELIYPTDSALVDPEEAIEFVWNKPKAGQATSYELFIYSDDDTSKITLADTSYLLKINIFIPNSTYKWQVKAINNELTAKSNTYSFTTQNIAPGPFSMVAPTNGDTVDATRETSFIWTKSLDIDPIDYTLSISGISFQENFIGSDTLFILPANTLEKESTYLVQVKSSDSFSATYTQAITINTAKDTTGNNPSNNITNEPLSEITLFPNPVSDILNLKVKLSASSSVSIELYNVSGSLVNSFNQGTINGSNVIQVDMQNYKSGVYFITIKSDAYNEYLLRTYKIIKL